MHPGRGPAARSRVAAGHRHRVELCSCSPPRELARRVATGRPGVLSFLFPHGMAGVHSRPAVWRACVVSSRGADILLRA